MFRSTAPTTIVIHKAKKFGIWRASKPVLAEWRDHGKHTLLVYVDLAPAGVSPGEYIRTEVAAKVDDHYGAAAPRVELGVKVAKAAQSWR